MRMAQLSSVTGHTDMLCYLLDMIDLSARRAHNRMGDLLFQARLHCEQVRRYDRDPFAWT